MENEVMNTATEMVKSEATEILDAVETTKVGGLKTAGIVLVIASAGVAAWELGIKPICRKVKRAINSRRNAKKNYTDPAEIDVANMNIDDDYNLDE